MTATVPETQTLRLERTYDCTPDELYDAWVAPQQYAKWFNPFPGVDAVIHEWDACPGGKIRFDMVTPEGQHLPNEGRFITLDRPREIVTGEEDGMKMRVTFEPVHGKTRMIMEQTGLPASVPLDQARAGWGAILEKLGGVAARGMATVEGQEIVMTRDIDAPRADVFAAWTDASQIDAWWGPDGFTTKTHARDVRPGGQWRFVMIGPDGTQYENLITYEEVTPPALLSYAHGTSDVHPDGFHVRVAFEDRGERTRLTMRMRLPSMQELEKVKAFGAVELGLQTLGRLADHLTHPAKTM